MLNTYEAPLIAEDITDAQFQIGAITCPLRAGELCGDVPAFWWHEDKLFLWLADGLGHGPNAHAAAQAARSSVQQRPSTDLQDIFARCDAEIRDTRGVAMGLVMIDPAANTLTFGGIGNIRALQQGETTLRHFSCSYGIIGAGFKSLFVEKAPFLPGETLVLASDGLPEHFSIPNTERLWDAQRLAETILSEWRTGTDDAGVLVCQWRPI